jgi:uncharacterized protein YbjT (DUF2867 family)
MKEIKSSIQSLVSVGYFGINSKGGNEMTVYVYGATGKVGTPLVSSLVSAGHEVRAATRNPRPAEGALSYVDSGDPTQIDGTNAVFLLSPPGVTDQYSWLKPYVDQAASSGVRKVVLMTAMGVEFAPDEMPMRKIELELLNSGLDATVIRPNWFMDNFHTFWISGILSDGKIYFPGGDAKVSFIDARDIGASAATLLTNGGHSGEGLTLTGPEALDHHQVAEKLSAVTGRTISYVDVDPQDFKQGMIQAGLGEEYADALVGLTESVRAGYAAPVAPTVKELLGREPISFDRYAADHREHWLAGA